MSQNRAVQAAQRRRAGGPEPAAPGRSPQPSINSSQMFSGQQQQQQQQVRPGTTGRLAGQQAQVQQQQMQQQQMQNPMQQAGENGVSKITIAQAITLITLRLGKAELQLYELAHQMATNGGEQGFSSQGQGQGVEGASDGMENMVLIDKNLIDSIMSRLESLEKRSPSNAVGTGSSTGSSADVTLLKQQFEAIKPSIANNTKATTALTKEQKEHKVLMDSLRAEMANTKDLLAALQTMSMDNSQKIFEIMSGEELIAHNDEDEQEEEEEDSGIHFSDVTHLEADTESEELEITGTSLKGIIEQELNA